MITGAPSSPLNATSVVVYGVSEYSLRVKWESPRDAGGVEIDNYTLSLLHNDQSLSETTTHSLDLTLTLNYSTTYTILITASNCAGSSNYSQSQPWRVSHSIAYVVYSVSTLGLRLLQVVVKIDLSLVSSTDKYTARTELNQCTYIEIHA